MTDKIFGNFLVKNLMTPPPLVLKKGGKHLAIQTYDVLGKRQFLLVELEFFFVKRDKSLLYINICKKAGW